MRDKTLQNEPKITNWHARSGHEVLNILDTGDSGLSSVEAKKRLAQYGKNQIKRTHHLEAAKIFVRQFWNLLIILLIVSIVIAGYLRDIQATVVLSAIVIVNILIGFFEEYKADRVMESLQKLLKPTAKVVRDGTPASVDAEDLVPGDIVEVEAGDGVPADIRLLEVDGLLTNDYALTGESTPSSCSIETIGEKVALADRSDMLYMGTTVAAGVGHGVVVGTGMDTELGNIAKLSQQSKPDASPLQKEISHLAKRITQGTVLLMVILVGVSLGAHFGLTEAFIFAIGIAAAMIPQGLPAEVNVALAQAAGKLARDRALVRRLTAVETLGATQIILTDKTGTLTKNEMTVTNVFSLDGLIRVEGSGFVPRGRLVNSLGHPLPKNELRFFDQLIRCGALANNASVHPPDSEHSNWYSVGDPTEAALITLAQKARITGLSTLKKRIKEFPFDSDRKRMSVVVGSSTQNIVYAKGSPESILEKSTHILLHGKVVKLTQAYHKQIINHIAEMSAQAMRNLAMAYRPIEQNVPANSSSAEQELIFLGVVSMIDPPRTEVAEAMSAAARAHMLVTIITGDEAATAAAIAERIGFASGKKSILITHNRLVHMGDRQIEEYILTGRAIFARVSPTDKLKLVNIMKRAGYILAVTGDGINDAPALKRADIGVAMGRIGSDVAKEAAEIVLLDDSFHTLVDAIAQGRVIFQNIRKTVHACITTNFGELGVVLIGLLMINISGLPLAITVPQILAIDLLAELFPLAALGWDPPTSNIMDDKPRDMRKHIMSPRAIIDVVVSGFVMAVIAYINFALVFSLAGANISKIDPLLYAQATTVVYLTIVFCQYVNVLSRRTAPGQSIFSKYLFTNWHLWVSFGLSVISISAIIYIPSLASFFGNGPVTLLQIGLAAIGAVVYLSLREVVKIRWQLSAS